MKDNESSEILKPGETIHELKQGKFKIILDEKNFRFGIDAVLLSAGCCDPLARRCLRVSMGCIFQVPWSMTGLSGAQIAENLKGLGIRTAAMALSADSVPVSDPSLKEALRLAVFLGNEGNGLPAKTIGSCDLVVRIPMRDGVDSLNVAAASAVTFWETRRP